MKDIDLYQIHQRLLKIEDEISIHDLACRFSDAVNERNPAAFRSLWAEDGVWEISPPLPMIAKGLDLIQAAFERLLEPKVMFMQMTHTGVIEFVDSNRATARFTVRERGEGVAGSGDFYENLAVYYDELVRTNGGWRFMRRRYEYRYLDTSPFSGEVFSSIAGESHPSKE